MWQSLHRFTQGNACSHPTVMLAITLCGSGAVVTQTPDAYGTPIARESGLDNSDGLLHGGAHGRKAPNRERRGGYLLVGARRLILVQIILGLLHFVILLAFFSVIPRNYNSIIITLIYLAFPFDRLPRRHRGIPFVFSSNRRLLHIMTTAVSQTATDGGEAECEHFTAKDVHVSTALAARPSLFWCCAPHGEREKTSRGIPCI
jgi:hypothetical protein